jgi:hypothetical protein
MAERLSIPFALNCHDAASFARRASASEPRMRERLRFPFALNCPDAASFARRASASEPPHA